MTWAMIWWGTFGSALAIMLACYMAAKVLWPWLQRNRWVIGDWEEWR